ncbi:scoloptoxin SSD14 isoform X2 [Anabrus simplex]|uniref:scoloptoxin SSD14 isoform X2 n=1 Tax=Anabrus simplex TaxID=316456 RepID=UPI0035A3705F
MTKFTRCLTEEAPEWDDSLQSPAERSRRPWMPKLQKRYVIAIGLVLLICAALLVVQLIYQLSAAKKRSALDNKLIPPNPEVPLPPSGSIEHRFTKSAVCSDGAPCSEVGKDILARNGSVVDAVVATMFCNGLVNCQSMGLGGGFLMTLYFRESKTAITLNAREAAPLRATERMFVDDPNLARVGPLAVGVPGELKGYWEAHQRYGKLPWADVVAPALKVCEEGYNMTKHQADALFFNPDAIRKDSTLREVFVDPDSGEFRKPGSLIRHKKLCETLRIISEKGNDLYNGSLAKMLASDIQEMGGLITEEDLRNYSAKWEEPIMLDMLDGDKFFSVPPPGSGALLGFILNILSGYNFTNKSVADIDSTISTYHRMIEAFKFAFGKRTELGDPSYVNVTDLIKNLTSLDYATSVRNLIQDNKTMNSPDAYGAVYINQEDHGTAHVSVIAPNGDAVSVTSTVNLFFGAGVTSKSTGIILNSGMDDFSSAENNNYFGLPFSPANSIQPGKRSMSSICPSIFVDKDGNVKLVIGAAGGTRITTAVAYVIVRHLWFGESIKQAVDASRIHHQLFPMEMNYEYGVLQQVIDGLEKLGHKTSRFIKRGSVICAISKDGEYIYANADYRKGGDVFGFD